MSGQTAPCIGAKPPRLLRSAGRNTTYGSQDLFRIAILAGKLQVRLQTLGAEYAPVWCDVLLLKPVVEAPR